MVEVSTSILSVKKGEESKTFFALDWYYTMIYIILAIVYIILYLAQFGFTF